MRIYTHPTCTEHEVSPGHPERPERLTSLLHHLHETGLTQDYPLQEAPQATFDDILRAHPQSHLDFVRRMSPAEGVVALDPDTWMGPKSLSAAIFAAGAVCAGVDELLNTDETRIFCAVRPPGHHAETNRVNGFCFFNNVAIATRYLQKKHQINKIAIIDFDVHHGNGTQEIFYQDESVLYGSIHESPLFPGTGSRSEIGVGNIFNAPIAKDTSGKEFIETFNNEIIYNVDRFEPEVIIISAGFDAHKRDPLASINLESRDFYIITKEITALANCHSQGRVISFLEGGYNLLALSESVLSI